MTKTYNAIATKYEKEAEEDWKDKKYVDSFLNYINKNASNSRFSFLCVPLERSEKGMDFNMVIRKVTEKDIDSVFYLLNELYENKIKYDIFSNIYISKISDKNCYYIVAIEDNKIVGVLISEISSQLHRAKKSIFVEDLIVNKDYRNRGIGKLLIEDAVRYAKELDCEVIELTSYLLNENAHRFYERNGFKKHSYKFKQYLN